MVIDGGGLAKKPCAEGPAPGTLVRVNIDIVQIPLPHSAEAPVDPLYEAYAHVSRAEDIHFYGNDDLVSDAREYFIEDANQKYQRTARWVAFPAGERAPERAVAIAAIDYPVADNTHLAYTWIVTHPEWRSQGIATALLPTIEESRRHSGRTTIQVWSNHSPYRGEDGLEAKSGVGRVNPAEPSARWLTALGYELEQTERHSVLDIPADDDPWWRELRARREKDAATAGALYELVQWQGATPPESRAEYARLRERMSVDAPDADLDFEEEKWDEERIADRDARMADMGRGAIMTAVRHVPSGILVAYSELYWPLERPAGVWQFDTFVHGEHRGHRLGALVKAANLQLLREVNPLSQRIHTWNAGENEHMLAINVELGFTPRSVEGGWQKRVGAPAP